MVGSTAVGLLPQVKGGDAAVADPGEVTPASLETSTLKTWEPPPAPKPEPKAKAPDASSLVDKVEKASDAEPAAPAPPKGSGSGYRIVFDQGDQRVWLVARDGTVARTYPVSGSRFDNLRPGTYSVQSRSRHAVAFDGSGTMEYFVRFATGFSEPIGFHSVPVDNAGRLEQTRAQLGSRLSAGCFILRLPVRMSRKPMLSRR